MKRILILVLLPVFIGVVPFVSSQDRLLGEEPATVPEFSGMVYIPPGEFLMGSTLDDLGDLGEQDEFPQRRVWVDGYYIDVHEVTNAQYKVFVDSTGILAPYLWEDGNYPVGRDGYPVTDISWEEAAAYARFAGKRLPTEEEWEKAARGTDGRSYPWGDKFNAHIVDMKNLRPVVSEEENRSPFGVYDMAGNAAEWVDAWYAAYPREPGQKIPKEVTTRKQKFPKEKYKVYRGGGYNTYGKYLRCANREREKPEKKWRYIGFRCAMDPPWQEK
jgi:formylglycine-generating enzyme required for sulfatase activity